MIRSSSSRPSRGATSCSACGQRSKWAFAEAYAKKKRANVDTKSIHAAHFDCRVPPQVVTEFVRTEFRHEGMPLDGIRYRSARHEGGNSLVLFASQDNLAGSMGAGIQSVFTGADRWIELVGREEREVSGSDAEAWDREAPQPFEWV